MSYSPIVLFVYNRPEHTLKTLESLYQNDLADESHLFIFCDGPKENATAADLKNINEVRKIIRLKRWCATVQITESDKNLTHPVNLIYRVTQLINEYGKLIVLEDDLVLGKGFLKYMNDALELYKDEPRVMHIAGYLLPVMKKNLPETFFVQFMSCWGWATWKRAWDHFIPDAHESLRRMGEDKDVIYRFNIDGSQDFHNNLKICAAGIRPVWDIRWYASIFIKDGLVLYPRKSLVRNIGNDGSGTHCDEDPFLIYQPITDYITVKPVELKENKEARRALRQIYFFLYDNSFFSYNAFKNFARKIIPRPLYNYLKNKKNDYLMSKAELK